MPTTPAIPNEDRTYFASESRVYYNQTFGGPMLVAKCESEHFAQIIAARLDKLAALEFSATNRGFTGIADELNQLAAFTGEIVQSSRMSPPEDACVRVELALETLHKGHSPRTWPVSSNPYLASEPTTVLDPNRVAGKDVSA